MKSVSVTCQTFLVVGLLTISGCADNSADGLMKQQIQEINNTADAMEAGTFEAEQEAIEARTKAIAEKLQALNLTIEQKQAVYLKHKDELQKATARLQKLMMKEMEKAMSKMSGQIGSSMSEAMENAGQDMKKSFGQ